MTTSTATVLQQAWSAVEEAELPEKVHEVAFREAIRIITGPAAAHPSHFESTLSLADAPSNGPARIDSPTDLPRRSDEDEDIVKLVGSGTGAHPGSLSALISVEDGVVRISVPGIKLGKNNAERTRAIAAILTVVRLFGLNEDDTPFELIREEAQRLKCYDTANFASQLRKLQGYLIKGTGPHRRLQAKGPGLTEFPNLIAKLGGDA